MYYRCVYTQLPGELGSAPFLVAECGFRIPDSFDHSEIISMTVRETNKIRNETMKLTISDRELDFIFAWLFWVKHLENSQARDSPESSHMV